MTWSWSEQCSSVTPHIGPWRGTFLRVEGGDQFPLVPGQLGSER